MIVRHLLLAVMVSLLLASPSRADVILGTFDFDSALFGNTLQESDGGAFSASNWLNVANSDPGNPGYLTGANFDTGIANIGFTGDVSYRIGYSTPIFNAAGDDLGIVVARFSSDPVTIRFSSDGVVFTPPAVLAAGTAVSTGVGRSYFYNGSGPFSSTLFVHPIDLTLFGFLAGDSIVAVRVGGTTELDLIRVAGFDDGVAVPEPGILGLLGIGLAGALFRGKRAGKSS